MERPSRTETVPRPRARHTRGPKPVCGWDSKPLPAERGRSVYCSAACLQKAKADRNAIDQFVSRLRRRADRAMDLLGSSKRGASPTDERLAHAAGEVSRLYSFVRWQGPRAEVRVTARRLHEFLAGAVGRGLDERVYVHSLELARDVGSDNTTELRALAAIVPALWARLHDYPAVARGLLGEAQTLRILSDVERAKRRLHAADELVRTRIGHESREGLRLWHAITLLRNRIALDEGLRDAGSLRLLHDLALELDDPIVWLETRLDQAGGYARSGDFDRAAECLALITAVDSPDLSVFQRFDPLTRLGVMHAYIKLFRQMGQPKNTRPLQEAFRLEATALQSARHYRIAQAWDGKDNRGPRSYIPLWGLFERSRPVSMSNLLIKPPAQGSVKLASPAYP
jgi:hypothetical protein